MDLSNPESSWVLVYVQGTLSYPFLLLLRQFAYVRCFNYSACWTSVLHSQDTPCYDHTLYLLAKGL